MPASKKPRKKATTKPIRVSEVDKIMSLLTAAMMDGDLDAFDTAHEALVSLADHGQKIDKAVFDDLAQMREQMLDLDADHAMIDAALWAGDMLRAEALEAALYGDDDFDDDDSDDGDGDDEEDKGGMIDITPGALPDAALDPYADLAAGKPGAVEALLAAGVDLNSHLGPDPRPALFAALEAPNRSAEMVARLVAAGADPLDLTEEDSETAMGWALLAPDMTVFDPDSERQLFEALLQHGADPDEGCGDFGSLLNRAIIMGLPVHVQVLLQAGAATDAQTPYDFILRHLVQAPSLVLAAPKPAVVALLLEAGADALATGSFGQTPLDFVTGAAADARAVQTDEDPWTVAHAAALTGSVGLMQDWANRRSALRN